MKVFIIKLSPNKKRNKTHIHQVNQGPIFETIISLVKKVLELRSIYTKNGCILSAHEKKKKKKTKNSLYIYKYTYYQSTDNKAPELMTN